MRLLIRFVQVCVCIVVMVECVLGLDGSPIMVHFYRAPPVRTRFKTTVFEYTVNGLDGFNECKNNTCSVYCQLDGQELEACPPRIITLRNLTVNVQHYFLLNITTRDGRRNSSSYTWFIDTIPPTATLFSSQLHTNAEKLAIDVTFSEPCTGGGGFKCVNSSNCNVLVDGPAHVEPSSLQVIEPNIKYSINLILSSKSVYGRVVIRMEDRFCTDYAGNHFKRTNNSVVIVHLDRRPLLGDLWTTIPSYVVPIDKVPRTVFATNKEEDLIICLDFRTPVLNTTDEIQRALHVNSGNLVPIEGQNHRNRRFGFRVQNISMTEIVTVKLRDASVIGRTGSRVSSVRPLSFLYDSSNLSVRLSTSSSSVTKESYLNAIVEFTKPVFGFKDAMIIVDGGSLTRFKELSRALYSLTVVAVRRSVVSISIPAGIVSDISGNLNLASNQLEVEHYSVPPISVALQALVTAGVLATSFAASVLAISSANLEAIDTRSTQSNRAVTSGLSTNLHGMVGHLQVFVLSDRLSDGLPIEYSETMKSLQWLIPRKKLPWKEDGTSMLPNHLYMSKQNLTGNSSGVLIGHPSRRKRHHSSLPNSTNSPLPQHELLFPAAIYSETDWLKGQQKSILVKNDPYGLPLVPKEYDIYFLRREPLYANIVVKRMENYKGWDDMEMNLFWLGVGGGSLMTSNFLIRTFLKWRMKTPANGILSFPHFELFLLILALPCIAQSSTFVIRGGTVGGIITGSLLLTTPAALILSTSLFLVVVIFTGKFVRYKEIQHKGRTETWFTKLSLFFVGKETTGKWFYVEGLPDFLQGYEILFESRKGPPLYIYVDHDDPNDVPQWIESEQGGIGRMRAVSTNDTNEEPKVSTSKWVLGCTRSAYVVLDLIRRVGLGVIAGAYTKESRSSHSVAALTITLVQLIYLFAFKPYITRSTQMVEALSLLSEASIFGVSMFLKGSLSNQMKDEKTLGYVMLSLFFVTFVSHIVNEWHAMINTTRRLSRPHKNSFKLGLKYVVKGFVLPFIPTRFWSSLVPDVSRPSTGLVAAPVIPCSPDTTTGERRHHRYHSSATSAATVVPMLSPSSRITNVVRTDGFLSIDKDGEGKRLKGIKIEAKSELMKLRELAKASFTSTFEEGSTSYGFNVQSACNEITTDHTQLTYNECKT